MPKELPGPARRTLGMQRKWGNCGFIGVMDIENAFMFDSITPFLRTRMRLHADKEFEGRVGTIERGRGAKGDRVRSEILKRQLPFSISEIEEARPGISRDMVRVILRAMKAEGVIAPTGKGCAAKSKQTGNDTSNGFGPGGPSAKT